ncbi:similar to Saccharomyces cerevisiae YIL040W APQ12 Protein required for nuclear envelope morphology, nuclear pore complex localization, mRNA export from the nucleus [Maudiozyma barnettii]|uniref:Similar to Saccharomyces cerevisiae YIL040W APQ12 Protein required for nuclear envelope morphology, nuclear pore complex localization, mRNA export from the nucleus n=1 Tax=Maudiozyma barnettii TaxID=61262 RepID=A0A8H2VJM6_9SACH|nr:Apq12p [Kazachstania barnettii]CAB4256570.1 similar to Saccharomyces cerevisiae YIL040W APQ12 Protein required for nuclear envelope morphology, nuclear pore complex localization, mRNA export from the nucleus [Kazachstania barnettii]CAD1785173.1 similar to Saccharomyces cerevisiae YIL040W APQ12 Protein required for nuclear envelope morphology, nuclear pore complex localization, mRNA export from the nucleus [Kazachstania barnettii]
MNFEQQGAPLEQTYERYVVLTLRYLIQGLQFIIPLVTKFSKENPTFFLILTTLILFYIAWKVIKNIFNILRRLFLLYLLVLVVSIHLRGWDQFINKDVPYIYNTAITTDNAYKVGLGVKFLVFQFKFYLDYLYHSVENLS